VENVDIHTHIGTQPTDDRAYATADLLRMMDDAGVQHALCAHWGAIRYDAREGNREAVRICATSPRLWPVAVINPAPHVGVRDTIQEAVALGCVGFRLMPGPHTWEPSGAAAARAFEWLDDAGLPTAIEIGAAGQATAVATATAGASLPVILAGVNYALLGEAIAVLERHAHCYLEASRLCTPGVVEVLCETVGSNRILFGSGAPEWHIRPTMAMIEGSGVTNGAIEAILGGNAQRLYHFGSREMAP